ncbi:hypothetical protein MMC29_001577 [Sticta canariensis]|nr:hypothetical protein [Sticta canariensis]
MIHQVVYSDSDPWSKLVALKQRLKPRDILDLDLDSDLNPITKIEEIKFYKDEKPHFSTPGDEHLTESLLLKSLTPDNLEIGKKSQMQIIHHPSPDLTDFSLTLPPAEPPSSPEALLLAEAPSLPGAPLSTGVPCSNNILPTLDIPDVLPKGVTHQASKNAYAAALEIITQKQSAAFHTALSAFATASTYHDANTTIRSEKGHIYHRFHNDRIGKIALDCLRNLSSYRYKEGATNTCSVPSGLCTTQWTPPADFISWDRLGPTTYGYTTTLSGVNKS